MRHYLIPAAVLMLAACQPATEATSDASERPAGAAQGQSPQAPPVEPPPAYIGSWVADLAWCTNTTGPERPIIVTATQFHGYENTCDITELVPTEAGWTATFVCQAEGQTTSRSAEIEANNERLQINWLDDGYTVDWHRCPA